MYEGNQFRLTGLLAGELVNGGRVTPPLPNEYQTPSSGGSPNSDPDRVTLVVDEFTFRYTIYRAGRDVEILDDPVSQPTLTQGDVTKIIDVGTDPALDTYIGPTGGGTSVARDLVTLSGLNGFPGVQEDKLYYLVTADGNVNNDPDYITLQLSETKQGSPISFSLSIDNATYTRQTERATIQVDGLTPHNLSVGNQVIIAGVSGDDYNGLQTVAFVTSPTSFQFDIPPLAGGPDVTNGDIDKNIFTGATGPAEHIKSCTVDASDLFTLIIRSGGGANRTRKSESVVEGMLVTGGNLPSSALVTDTDLASRTVTLDTANTTDIGGGGANFTFQAGVIGSKAIALDNSGTYPQNEQIAPGMLITGTGIPAGTLVTSSYISSVDEGGTVTPYWAYVSIDTALTADLNSTNNPFVFSSNVTGCKSVRVTNVTPAGAVPQIGAEIESFGGSTGNVFTAGTLITDVTPYTIGATSGFLIAVDNPLLVDFDGNNGQIIQIFPDANAGSGGTVSPIQAEFDSGNPTEILNEDTTFSGQITLASEQRGWDHVALARDTGGALFFQLGYALLCSGTFGSNDITVTDAAGSGDLIALGANLGIGVYGCLLYTSPSPRDATLSRMPSSA